MNSEKEYRLPCSVCGVDISHNGISEYPYMVHPHLWKLACEDCEPKIPKRGYMCIGCIEKRLGRILTVSDFTEAPINDATVDRYRSERLISRQVEQT